MSTTAIRGDWIGRVVDGRFALLEWLGGSDSGGVFLTELPQPIPKKAAIKLLAQEGNEADTLAGWARTTTLAHPHLMRLFRSGRFQFGTIGMVYVVTEYAEEVLSQIIPERPLTPGEAKEMIYPVLDALSYLHDKGFVHGHVKPSNIMVVEDHLKLSVDSLCVAGVFPDRFKEPSIYDPPEGFDDTVSSAADVWSLGVTLVEVLTQCPPVWERSISDEPIVPESIPSPFAEIARECLRLDPSHRCTIADIKARLEPGAAHLELVESPEEPADEMNNSGLARIRKMPLVVALLVVLVIIAAWLMRSHKTTGSSANDTQQPSPTASAVIPQSPKSQPPQGLIAKGAVAKQVLPEVPTGASRTIRGTVAVAIRVSVDRRGEVSNAAFESPGPSKFFANLALQAARSWMFRPAKRGGQAVPSVWILRFRFNQNGDEATGVEQSP
jgi:TonB family protein